MGQCFGGSFQAIQEYFRHQYCRFCDHRFSPDGIRLIRQEPGILVVRVTCSACWRPLGVAIVGTTIKPPKKTTNSPGDWTRRDCARLSGKPAITYDDVLSAHEFLSSHSTDWTKHLPQVDESAR